MNPESIAIPFKYLDDISVTVTENENISRKGIEIHLILHNDNPAISKFTHTKLHTKLYMLNALPTFK